MVRINTDVTYEIITKYDFLIGDIYRLLYFDYCGNPCYFENFCIKEDYTRQELEDTIVCHRLVIAYSPPYPKKITSLHELQNMNIHYC